MTVSILALMIRVRNLSHRFGEKVVLRDISFEVRKGETLAIMGGSGGGKTTLLRCMAGLLPPTSGTVEILEKDFYHSPERVVEEMRRRIGVVFQGAALFDYLNVFDNVTFGVKRQKKMSLEELEQLVKTRLELVGLDGTEKLFPSELSGGMRKRVGVARALASDPEILFYDEPTSGLDPILAYAIDGLIKEVSDKTHATSIVVSHEVNSVLRIADRVIFLHEGRIEADARPSEFVNSKDERIRELIDKAEAVHVEPEVEIEVQKPQAPV